MSAITDRHPSYAPWSDALRRGYSAAASSIMCGLNLTTRRHSPKYLTCRLQKNIKIMKDKERPSVLSYKPGDLQTTDIYSSQFWNLGGQRSSCQQIGCLVRITSWFISAFWLCLHRTEGVRELSGASFIRVLIAFMKASPSWSNHLSKGSTCKYFRD